MRNTDGGLCLILNLKKLNEKVEYEKFKMETIATVIRLMRPEMFMAKLDMKDAYYSIPILGSHQKHLKFNYNNELYKNTSLPNGYTKVPIKFTKKPLKLPLSD